MNNKRSKQFHLDITKNNLKEMDIKYFNKFPEYY